MRKLWPWESVDEVPLSNGVVMLAISVPPYALVDVHAELPPPPVPIIELKSEATGDVERARALPGSPEWEEYVIRRKKYDSMVHQKIAAFRIDYGSVGWRYPNMSEDDEPVDMPPNDYEPPPIMKRWGVETDTSDDTVRRLAFIKYVLIRSDDDETALSLKWDGKQPPTRREVAAAGVPFESLGETEQT